MQVHQFRYNGDNFAYLLEAGGEALAVDGGAVDALLKKVSEKGLRLLGVTHTHDHPDHVQGNAALSTRSGAPVLGHGELSEKGRFQLGGEMLRIWRTPGHTLDSVCFIGEGFLLSGDTLFNGTVGNCFSGDLDAFFRSVENLLTLPKETKVYAGHDYVREAMAFARSIEPENPHIQPYLEAWNPACGFSTLAQEVRVNPYLRYNDPVMTALLARRGLSVETPLKRWHSLMEVY